jgi:hypothetical protein
MPISNYFGGSGETVMKSMKSTYKDPKKAKQVFYALNNKKKSKGAAGSQPRPKDGTA